MTHITVSGIFETADSAIENVRKDQGNLRKIHGDHIPVIIATKISPRKTSYGVQYWTLSTIMEGESINSDNTIAKYVDHL